MSKVVVVTGASSGIGKDVASFLSTKGFQVFGTSRLAVNGEANENFKMVRMDVTDENSVLAGIQYIVEIAGGIDALVNNAGLGMVGPIENISDSEAKEIFNTNVFGILNVCRACVPLLRSRGGGHIINITSIAGLMGLPFRGIYSASKFAVEGFTESLSQEVHQFGIKVSIIEPGDFKTNINNTRRVASFVDKNAYQSQCEETLSQINHEVENAPKPIAVGMCVEKILRSQNPRLRYRVATLFVRFSLTLKKILPERLFEKLIMIRYKLR